MTEEQIKEMLNGIINNGEKWEYRWCTADGWSNWKDYKLGYEIFDNYEYRKVEKKTWLEEYLAINFDNKIEAHNSKIDIENVCKKILEELPKYLSESLYCEVVGNLRLVFKDLGIKL